MTNNHEQEFQELLQLAIDSQLTGTDLRRVQELMQQTPALMHQWVDHFQLDALLADELDQHGLIDLVDLVAPKDATVRVASRQISRVAWPLGVVAAVGALAASVMWIVVSANFGPTDNAGAKGGAASLATDHDVKAIATLVQSSNDQWHLQSPPPRQLPPGRLRLDEGLAEIEIYNGVRLYLKGPIDLDLVSLDQAHLRSGKLRAVVPEQAQGFSVTTDSMLLVDRGTEFAVDTEVGGVAKVHVFDGRVDLYPLTIGTGEKATPIEATARVVGEGESVEVGTSFTTRDTQFDTSDFPSADSIDKSVAQRLQRWSMWSEEFAKRDDLLVYFTFEDATQQKSHRTHVKNLAARDSGDAIVVGSEMLTGRWPGKTAVGFYNQADRVRIRVPGRFGKMTFACWLRLEDLRGVNQALMLTDTFEPWQPHWQIAKEGVLKLGFGQATKKASRQLRSASRPLVEFSPIGRWVHFATVYNSKKKTVQHYVNGQPAGSKQLPVADLLHIGTAEIGNWLKPRTTGDQPIRNLDGRIDEFMIFKTALNAEEIAEIYRAGR